MKFIRSIFIYFFTAILFAVSTIGSAFAQQPILRPNNAAPDTILRSASLKTDTVTKKINTTGSLTSKVTYAAEDSTIFDMKNNIVFLYGNAKVKYEDFEIEAEYIRLDQKNNSIFAKGRINPVTKRYIGKPLVIQGAEPPLSTDSLFFNYKTKKGKSFGIFTDVEGGFLQAQQFKKNQYDEGFFKPAPSVPLQG